MRLLAILMLALLAAAASGGRGQDPYFPERALLPDDEEGNSFTDDMISGHPDPMKEPSLWALSRKRGEANAYRFLWLHCGKYRVSIRLVREGHAFALHVAGHDGPPERGEGKLVLCKEIKLTDRQGESSSV